MDPMTTTETFPCGWVCQDGYTEDGEPYTFRCGALATGTDRGWTCENGHGHVNAEVRADEGWDYYDDDEIAAFRSGAALAYTNVRDIHGNEVRS